MFVSVALVPASIGFAIFVHLTIYNQALGSLAAVIYCLTVFAVIVAYNVPINEKLEQLPHTDQQAGQRYFW
jgi:uncharacterized membrane protein